MPPETATPAAPTDAPTPDTAPAPDTAPTPDTEAARAGVSIKRTADALENSPMKGVRVLTQREVRKQHAGVLFIAIFPFVGVLAAAALAWGHGLGWSDLAVFAIMYTIPILGITVGFHRMLTHASFDTKPWVRNTWAVFGSLAIEGDPITWVADHRRHHAHSDKEGDPHSPHLHHDDDDDHTLTGTLKGLYHAHFGWLFKKEGSDVERWCPDLLKLPGLVAISSKFYLFTIATFALPALLGFLFTGGSWMGALTGFIWGGPVRVFFAHHVTFSTNSICHFFGKRPYDSGDHSTNNWMLSILSFGESWHNNHHAFPSSAVHGLEKHQIDISAMIIRGMEKLRLVSNVRTPSARAMERKRVADTAPVDPA